MTLHQLHRGPWRLVGAAATWHVASQQRARRNALVASTALTREPAGSVDGRGGLPGRARRPLEWPPHAARP